VKDYRRRKWQTIYGITMFFLLRRLRCCKCGKLHTELPDKLLPYKRYEAKAIEKTISGKGTACVASMRTKKRWIRWFERFRKMFPILFICRAKKNSGIKADKESTGTTKEYGWLQYVVSKIINTGEKIPT